MPHIIVEADYGVHVKVWIDDVYQGVVQTNLGQNGRDFVLKSFPPGQHTVKVMRGR